MQFHRTRGLAAAVVLALGLLVGCQNATSSHTETPGYKTYLYITDTGNGHVGAWDSSTHKMVTSSLVTTANSAGEIRFYKGIGYVAVGSGSGAGVYRFDPSATAPAATLVSGTAGKNAQYFAFVTETEAYFSTADYPGSGSIYRFNPSNTNEAATLVTTPGGYLQELVLGTDGSLYVAVNDDAKVKRIDPTTKAVTGTFGASQSRTTGLFAGTFDGKAGVYVANTGGSLDFLPYSAKDGATATPVASVSVGRVTQGSSVLVASGWSNSYLITLSGSSATVTELKSAAGTSFGTLSVVAKSGLFYLPSSTYGVTGSSKVYAFDTAGKAADFSPASVLDSADSASNAAFYEE